MSETDTTRSVSTDTSTGTTADTDTDTTRDGRQAPGGRTAGGVGGTPGYVGIAVADAPVKELFPGIRSRPLWTGDNGAKAQVLEMDPGSCWEGIDVHEPGPEEVFVVSGTFNDGERDHPAGSFIHAPAGSWHVPRSAEGCNLFVFYPEG